MAKESGLYNTINIIQTGNYPKKLDDSLTMLNMRPAFYIEI
jgi:hypothetical protein